MKDKLNEKISEVNNIILPFFKANGGFTSTLASSMEYSLTAGGKRLRPMMMREAAILFGNEPKGLGVFMAAIEMIHTYSLVHDDLPAMDNDMLRHGKPSTHAVYGEAAGILCGDALLTLAFEIMLDYCRNNPSKEAIQAVYILASHAGDKGMVGGQALDVTFDKTDKKPEIGEIEYIYENKTGKLIRASLTMGATLAKADKSDIKKLDRIGENIGFAFQVVDDILDIEGDETLLGKPIGSDAKNEKYTYVSHVGIDAAKDMVNNLTNEAIDSLETLPGDKTFLKELFLYLVKRNS